LGLFKLRRIKKPGALHRAIGIKLSNKGTNRENSCTTNIQTEDALDVYEHR